MVNKESCLELLKDIYNQDEHALTDELIHIHYKKMGGEKAYADHLEYIYRNGYISDPCFKQSVDGIRSFYSGPQCKITAKGIALLTD